LCWLLEPSAHFCGVKRAEGGVSCYFVLISQPKREQHVGQIPSLASSAHQTLDKACCPASVSSLLSDITRRRSDLIVENALLRQQLIVLNRQIKRPQLTHPDRFHLVLLAQFTKFWKQVLHIVQPDTLLRWHRELFCFYWWRKSHGQPKISLETIALIRKMAGENYLWGAEQIRGEL